MLRSNQTAVQGDIINALEDNHDIALIGPSACGKSYLTDLLCIPSHYKVLHDAHDGFPPSVRVRYTDDWIQVKYLFHCTDSSIDLPDRFTVINMDPHAE